MDLLDVLISKPVASFVGMVAFALTMLFWFGSHDGRRRSMLQNFIIRWYKIHRWAYAVLLGMDAFVSTYEANRHNPYSADCDTAIAAVVPEQEDTHDRQTYLQ